MIFRKFPRLYFFGPLALLFGGAALGYGQIQSRLSRPAVIEFLENRAGEFLHSQVKIEKARYLPPFQIALEGVELDSGSQEGAALASVKKLAFGYSVLNLIRRDFRFPTTFRLVHPEIRLDHNPASLFSLGDSRDSAPVPGKVVIDHGTFRYQWGEGRELILERVKLKAQPDARGQIGLKLSAHLGGVASGEIEVRGISDPLFQKYKLEVRMEKVVFSPESSVPLRDLSGKFSWTEKLISLTDLKALYHGWEIQAGGQIEDWQAKPRIALEVKRKKGEPPFALNLNADFQAETLSGAGSWGLQKHAFRGKARLDAGKILFEEVALPGNYVGNGEVNPRSGSYDFRIQREQRRFQIQSNWNRLEFETNFQLDHASINHLDWAVSGRIHLSPLPKQPADANPRFLGSFETDYFVIEYEPFEDLNGTFEAGTDGIQAIHFNWGKVFNLEGRVLFQGNKAREDLVLRVGGFPLESVKDFAGRPIRSRLGGTLEGKLKLRGESTHPEVEGYFTIKGGLIDKVDFDRAMIQFRGFPPYLQLFDSSIFKGRNTLALIGAIDLRLENIFHGVKIQRPDHLVIWKGMSVSWKEGESAVEAEKSLALGSGKMTLGIEVGAGVSETNGEDPEETHALIGPKLKF